MFLCSLCPLVSTCVHVDTMDTLSLDELLAMADRSALQCVRIENLSRAQVALLASQLGGKMCGHTWCPILSFPAWPRTRCVHCRPAHNQPTQSSSPAQSIINSASLIEQTTNASIEVQKKTERMMIDMGWAPPSENKGFIYHHTVGRSLWSNTHTAWHTVSAT